MVLAVARHTEDRQLELDCERAAYAAHVSSLLTHRHATCIPANGSDPSRVTVVAESLDATDQAIEDLAAVALDAPDWANGWRRQGDVFAIDFSASAPTEFIDDYVAREMALRARRRPELEQVVLEALGGLKVIVTDSGTEGSTSRGYVEIAAKAVDDADEARVRLEEIANVSAETWLRGWRSDYTRADGAFLLLRIYPS